jgi:hypothetical protein
MNIDFTYRLAVKQHGYKKRNNGEFEIEEHQR